MRPGNSSLPALLTICQSSPTGVPGKAVSTMRSPSISRSRAITPAGVTSDALDHFCLTRIRQPLLACYYVNDLIEVGEGVNMDRRVVCVSGSTQGIGLAIAEAFA